VSDEEPTPPEDPWLTLAEIAEELRMSPATIRSWISKGTLRAMRAGQRKWLVRRSELDRMLAGEDLGGPDDPPGAEPGREMDTILPPHSSPHWTDPEAIEHVSRSGWLGVAQSEWQAALEASAMAPPDAWFAYRIRTIAEAAARKAAAIANLDAEPPAWWQRQRNFRDMTLTYELRPGGNRPGPAPLWARFDATVHQLSLARQEGSLDDERMALERLSLVMHELADTLIDSGRGAPWPADEVTTAAPETPLTDGDASDSGVD